jgi:hypothetical protein
MKNMYLKFSIFWDVMSCGVLEVLVGQGGTFYKVETLTFTEAGDSRPYRTIYVCQKTWRHVPEGRKLLSFGIKTLKSHLYCITGDVWMQ